MTNSFLWLKMNLKGIFIPSSLWEICNRFCTHSNRKVQHTNPQTRSRWSTEHKSNWQNKYSLKKEKFKLDMFRNLILTYFLGGPWWFWSNWWPGFNPASRLNSSGDDGTDCWNFGGSVVVWIWTGVKGLEGGKSCVGSGFGPLAIAKGCWVVEVGLGVVSILNGGAIGI